MITEAQIITVAEWVYSLHEAKVPCTLFIGPYNSILDARWVNSSIKLPKRGYVAIMVDRGVGFKQLRDVHEAIFQLIEEALRENPGLDIDDRVREALAL